MKCALKNKISKKEIIIFDLIIYPYDLVISNIYCFFEDVPEPFSYIKNLSSEKQIQILEAWLKNRAVPNFRNDIDDYLLNRYSLKHKYAFGRMYETQYLASLLSYFISFADDFYVTPLQDEVISFFNIDSRFSNIYLWKSDNFDFNIYDNINLDYTFNHNISKGLNVSNNRFWDITPTDTLHTQAASFCFKEINTNHIYINQNLSHLNEKQQQFYINYLKSSGLAVSLNLEHINIGFINIIEIVWIRDIILFLKDIKNISCVSSQQTIKNLLELYFADNDQIINDLFETEQQFMKNNIPIDINNLGILKTNINDSIIIKPIVLL